MIPLTFVSSLAVAKPAQLELTFRRADVDRDIPSGDRGKEFVADLSEVDPATGARTAVRTEILGQRTAGGGRVLDRTNADVTGIIDIYGYKTRTTLNLSAPGELALSSDDLVEEGFRFSRRGFGIDKSGRRKGDGFPGDEGESGGAKTLNPHELLVFDFADGPFQPRETMLVVERADGSSPEDPSLLRGFLMPLQADGAGGYVVLSPFRSSDYSFEIPVDPTKGRGGGTFTLINPAASAVGVALAPGEAARVGIAFTGISSAALCGNDNIDDGEACDDGNTIDGDGCSAACGLELGTTCPCWDGGADAFMGATSVAEYYALASETYGITTCIEQDECSDSGSTSFASCRDGGGSERLFSLANGSGCRWSIRSGDAVIAEANVNLTPLQAEVCLQDHAAFTPGDSLDFSCGLPLVGSCGNGVVEGDEQCDDENRVDGDGCSASCEIEVGTTCPCWDGGADAFMGATSVAEYYALASETYGITTCIEQDECSDSGSTSFASCRDGGGSERLFSLANGSGCRWSIRSGDAVIAEANVNLTPLQAEVCLQDHAAFTPGDSLDFSCGLPLVGSCGNGVVEGDEQCDDENRVDGDGCSSSCEIEVGTTCPCWDGGADAFMGATSVAEYYALASETYGITTCIEQDECSDSGSTSFASCRDGGGSERLFSLANGSGCRWSIRSGDAVIAEANVNLTPLQAEVCLQDHAAFTPGDSLDFSCGLPLVGSCGNGVVEGDEQCDDENRVDGDGCSASCELEVGTTCPCWNGGADAFMGATSVAEYYALASATYGITTCLEQDQCSDSGSSSFAICRDDGGSERLFSLANGSGCRWSIRSGDAVIAEANVNLTPLQAEVCLQDHAAFTPGDGLDFSCGLPLVGSCGNGVVEGDEQCDDENRVDGDGCSAVCGLE